MRNQQQGFTLIELVAVIVILGALAVVALPRFVNLQDEARQAGVEGVAGALGSGAALNFAAVLASADDEKESVVACADAEKTLQNESMPNGYSIVGPTGTGSSSSLGDEFGCEVQHLQDPSASASFNAIYVSSGDF